MKKILLLDAWQLFALLLSPMVIAVMGYSFGFFIVIITYIIWLYLVGTSLIEKQNNQDYNRRKNFQIGFIFISIFLLLNFVMEILSINIQDVVDLSNNNLGSTIFLFIYLIISVLYIIYLFKTLNHISKLIKYFDNNVFSPFLLLIFFPFGIWFLQPSIKRIFSSSESIV